MFTRIAELVGGPRELFCKQPAVIAAWLQVMWKRRRKRESLPYHLIYSYMIENTRVYEVFRRVVHELRFGEKLGVPSEPAQAWLRNTEELFYRDPPSYLITAVTSQIRPDMGAVRRNAYQRMFGMDLNHGRDDNQPYPYIKADAANNEFVVVFEELLREVWIAISNVNNGIGPNPTDRGKITILVESLQKMLAARRLYNNLAREEFVSVAMMSWFHLTMMDNYPIVESLTAQASSPEQRLFKIAQRVGLPAHGQSKSYFDIAEPIALLLLAIERLGVAIVPEFLIAGATQTYANTVITHWSLITGRDIKASKVATVGPAMNVGLIPGNGRVAAARTEMPVKA